MDTPTPIHVVVIGGGIGGLCLAQGLRRSGVSVAVYERDRTPDARLQGYRLNIEPPGSRALHECLPSELWDVLVAAAGDPGPGMGVFDEQLHELMREYSNAAPADPASSTHALSRVTLRRLLLAGLDDAVHFDKEFVHYERSGDGRVTACFADGSSATGDLLVGADGVGSRVRRQLLPQARRLDIPAIGIGGKLPLTEETAPWLPADVTTNKNMILPRRDFMFTAVYRRRERPDAVARRLGGRLAAVGLDPERLLHEAEDDDYVMWAFVAHRRSLPAGTRGLRGRPLQELVEQQMGGWHAGLRRLVAESAAETIEQFDFGAAARVTPWSSTNVTLLGDAVHSMPPVAGMGGNTALRDANLLRRTLTEVHRGKVPLMAAMADYEAEMLRYSFAAVREVRLYTWLAISQRRTLRGVARSFFRLCGAIPPLRHAIFKG